MKVQILDSQALKAVSPAALTAYARSEGWEKTEPFGEFGDLYTGKDKPEIVLPRTDRLGDYVSVVSRLLGVFSEISGSDELSVYREVVSSVHDVITIRSCGGENDGSVGIDDGVALVVQARELLLAAACAVKAPQSVYRTEMCRDAVESLKRVRLDRPETGSFALSLTVPVSPRLRTESLDNRVDFDDEPYERQVVRRLVGALEAAQRAIAKVVSGDVASAFDRAVKYGVSANLCDTVAKLVERSEALEIRVDWAYSRPAPESRKRFNFSESDARLLKEAARIFRLKLPGPGTTLYGYVQAPSGDEGAIEGRVTFKVDRDGKTESLGAVLDRDNYSRAVRAYHKDRAVAITGDLERVKQRWQISNVAVRELDGGRDKRNEPV